jgi:hypothetical protein
MEKEVYFVKSFEEDFILKTLRGKKKAPFQSIHSIIKSSVIKPNTKSFGREMRLATTILHKNYLKTYRPQGLIFQTNEKPKYVLPFDLVLLSKSNKIVVHYYRIKNHLHEFYNHELIEGFEKFIFDDFEKLIEAFPSPQSAWEEVNRFRKLHGYSVLPKQKYRLVEYDEAVFTKPIKIRPVALFGYRSETRELARKLGLHCYISAKDFYKKIAVSN